MVGVIAAQRVNSIAVVPHPFIQAISVPIFVPAGYSHHFRSSLAHPPQGKMPDPFSFACWRRLRST